MRRRVPLTNLNPRDCRAPVPSGAGMGAAAVTPPPSPVSRVEEEAKAQIWYAATDAGELYKWDGKSWEQVEPSAKYTAAASWDFTKIESVILTPTTDPTANAPKKRGWPKGKKRKP